MVSKYHVPVLFPLLDTNKMIMPKDTRVTMESPFTLDGTIFIKRIIAAMNGNSLKMQQSKN